MELQLGIKFEELQFNPPILSLSDNDFCDSILSSCYLISIMCFPGPESEALRKKSTALLYAASIAKANDSSSFSQLYSKIDASFIESIIFPPPIDISELLNNIVESQKNGNIAGEIIHNIYCMNKIGINQPSYNKSRAFIQYDVEKQCLGISYSNSTIDRCWSQYRNVSHLWAAMQYLKPNEYKDGPLPITELIDEENVVMLLSVAEHFRFFGENYVTHNTNANSQRTLFAKGEAWRPAPNFPLFHSEWDAWGEGRNIIPDLKEKLTYFKSKRKMLK